MRAWHDDGVREEYLRPKGMTRATLENRWPRRSSTLCRHAVETRAVLCAPVRLVYLQRQYQCRALPETPRILQSRAARQAGVAALALPRSPTGAPSPPSHWSKPNRTVALSGDSSESNQGRAMPAVWLLRQAVERRRPVLVRSWKDRAPAAGRFDRPPRCVQPRVPRSVAPTPARKIVAGVPPMRECGAYALQCCRNRRAARRSLMASFFFRS